MVQGTITAPDPSAVQTRAAESVAPDIVAPEQPAADQMAMDGSGGMQGRMRGHTWPEGPSRPSTRKTGRRSRGGLARPKLLSPLLQLFQRAGS